MIKKWITSIRAIDPMDGELKNWVGPIVEGITMKDAWNYCQMNGLGYCTIEGELIAEIPCDGNTLEAAFDKAIDYEKIKWN